MLGDGESCSSGVVIALSKAHFDGSTTVVYCRKLQESSDGLSYPCGYQFRGIGNPFQLKTKEGRTVFWSNEEVRSEGLEFGSIFRYRKLSPENQIFQSIVGKNQKIDKILYDLAYDCGAYKGVEDAFPEAKISEKLGLYHSGAPPDPRICLIEMTQASIKDERIKFTTKRHEVLDLKLTCRVYGQMTTHENRLPVRQVDMDTVGDVALVRFSRDPAPFRRNPTFYAVCDGIVAKFMAKVISRKEEEIKIVNGNNQLVSCEDFNVLFDTGNDAMTGISQDLLNWLGIKEPITKAPFITEGVGGTEPVQYYQVSIEMFIRDFKFTLPVLIGAPAPGTDLLIGYDIIGQLLSIGYTIGD